MLIFMENRCEILIKIQVILIFMDNRCEILNKKHVILVLWTIAVKFWPKTGNSYFYGQSLWNFEQKNR
jgi:hypothetical protein